MKRWITVAATGPLLTVLLATPALASAKEQPETQCQTATVNGNSHIRMCMDRSGNWHQVDSQDNANMDITQSDMPSQARIIYGGQYTGSEQTALRMNNLNLNNLNVGSIFRQVTDNRSRPMEGSLSMTMVIKGSDVNATVAGTGGITPRQLVGQIRNSICHLAGASGQGTAYFDGECTRRGFSGTFKGQSARGNSYSGRFETSATQFVDLEQTARDQLAAQKANEAKVTAAAEALRNAPSAGPLLTKKLDALVASDSKGWVVNKYDTGSMANVKIVDGSVKSGHYVMRGEYTYNGGAGGWVLAKMSGTSLDCIQFHDAMIGCRVLRTAAQGTAMRDMLIGAANGNGSRSSQSQTTSDNFGQMSQQRFSEEQQQRAQAEREQQAAAAAAQNEAMQHPNSLGW